MPEGFKQNLVDFMPGTLSGQPDFKQVWKHLTYMIPALMVSGSVQDLYNPMVKAILHLLNPPALTS